MQSDPRKNYSTDTKNTIKNLLKSDGIKPIHKFCMKYQNDSSLLYLIHFENMFISRKCRIMHNTELWLLSETSPKFLKEIHNSDWWIGVLVGLKRLTNEQTMCEREKIKKRKKRKKKYEGRKAYTCWYINDEYHLYPHVAKTNKTINAIKRWVVRLAMSANCACTSGRNLIDTWRSTESSNSFLHFLVRIRIV
jgi:hypothetical protein